MVLAIQYEAVTKQRPLSRTPSVVVVGGGFAGLECARELARAKVAITLIDKKNHHCFQPLLYQVATASLSPADIAWPIRSLLSRQENASVVMGEVRAVDTLKQQVMTAERAYDYDHLVLATGASHSYFGHPEWAAVAPGLKTIEDATRIRSGLLASFEKAEIAEDSSERQRHLTFVVVGGGPTGVELAGSIADIARNVLAADFRRIDPREARVILIEAGDKILPNLDLGHSAYASRALKAMGVELRLSESVVRCELGRVVTSNGSSIQADNILWAAGVRGSEAASWLNYPTDRARRIRVNDCLQVPNLPNVYVIGDTASVLIANSAKAVPGLAPAAKQMGSYVGRAIAQRIAGKENVAAFVYRHQGDLATMGRRSAVVSYGRLKLTGTLGWLFWSIIHVYFLIGHRNRIVVALNWCWEYITFKRGARLISR
jgi:NADH dehydrogenase